MYKRIVFIGIIGSLFLSTQAWALFHVDSEAGLICNGRKVSEIGTGVSIPMQGFGHAITLDNATKVLLPPGWVAVIDKSVADDTLNWKEGDSWTQAATSAPDRTACYVIDWNTRTFYASRDVKALEAQVAADDPINSSQAQSAGVAMTMSASKSADTKKKSNIVDDQSDKTGRSLYPGSMQTQVSDWAKSAGFNLTWTAPDYTVPKQSTIKGDFKNAVQQALDTASANSPVKYKATFNARTGELLVSQIMPPAPKAHWELRPGGLKSQLDAWAEKAKYQVVWKSPDDFLISTDSTLNGNFPEVVQQVVDGMHETGSTIAVKIYEGNHTVVVTETN